MTADRPCLHAIVVDQHHAVHGPAIDLPAGTTHRVTVHDDGRVEVVAMVAVGEVKRSSGWADTFDATTLWVDEVPS